MLFNWFDRSCLKAPPRASGARKLPRHCAYIIPSSLRLVFMGALRPLLGSPFALRAVLADSSGVILCLWFPFVGFWVPMLTLQVAKCIVFLGKTNDFAKRRYRALCSSKAPRVLPTAHFSPSKLPLDTPSAPPRARQGPPMAPRWTPQTPPGARLGAQVGLAKHVVL